MQTATGQTIQSVKDTFGKVVVCNAADPRSQQNICRENAYAVSPYAQYMGYKWRFKMAKYRKLGRNSSQRKALLEVRLQH